MTPKNKLFLGILIFGLIVNLLIIFNLNYLYIRAILAFIFIIIIPGLLIMLALKIRNINFWEYLVYTIGLSVAFIMFAGLAVNWILPWLSITDKPLSLYPILICFDTILLGLWLIAHKRNEDNTHILIFPFQEYEIKGKKRFRFIPKFPSLSWLDRIFIIIPICFPFMAVIGAFLLNNHGTNIVTMIMLASIAIYVLLVVIFRDRLNENVYPWALYCVGLALLLMFSMRSWFFIGSDVVLEYHYMTNVIKNNFWDIISYPEGYNVCLSVTILPKILKLFINSSNMMLLKLVMQLISPTILIIIYSFFRKFWNPLFSFLAGFFFVSQSSYLFAMPSHTRQEIAFIFFGLMFLVLFSREINPGLKKILFVIFGFSMIVSHYSTAYVALALFLLTYLCIFLYKKYENNEVKKGKLEPEKKSEFYLTGITLLLLLVFGFLWYSQVTLANNDLINLSHKIILNYNNLFDQDFQMEGQSFLDQFRVKPINKNYMSTINNEIENIENNINNSLKLYPPEKINSIKFQFASQKALPQKFSSDITSLIYIFFWVIKKFGYIFVFIGLVYSMIISKKRNNSEIFLISLIGLFSLSFVVLITIIPFGSISYGALRLYQQGLIIISIFGIIGSFFIVNMVTKKKSFFVVALFLIFYFFIFNGFFNQIVGGNLAFPNLNNFGNHYDLEYISSTEITSINWLSYEGMSKKFYAGRIYYNSFKSFGPLPMSDYYILPKLLIKDSYVYSGNSEVYNGIGFISISQLGAVPFNFPTEFLNDNKNKIYNNGGSEIFR